ncbi:MAG: discoidin domain-containing protein [Gammaproteobacteria bacterium]
MTGMAAYPEDGPIAGADVPGGWQVIPVHGASAVLAAAPGHDGDGLRLDYDFGGPAGIIILRHELAAPIELPPNYVFSYMLRGDERPINLEFKLIDPTGDNVWWSVKRGYEVPGTWRRLHVRKAQVGYAWGKDGGGDPGTIGAIEIAITSTSGGRGSLWLDNLVFESRPPVDRQYVQARLTATSAAAGHPPEAAMDANPASAWRSAPDPGPQELIIDLGREVDFGGLVIDWDNGDAASSFNVETSSNGTQFELAYTTSVGASTRSYVFLPDAESRFIRLRLNQSASGRGYGIRNIKIEPWAFSESVNAFYTEIARNAPRGHYPRYLLGEQAYWTVVGMDGNAQNGLLGEDGALEVGRGEFSIEPFLLAGGRLLTWADVNVSHSLEQGTLPIPTATWEADGLRLDVTAFRSGPPGTPALYARYRVTNTSREARAVRLVLAARPFQVNPPWQSLNLRGGTAAIRSAAFDGRALQVNGGRAIASLAPVAQYGAMPAAAGSLVELLAAGRFPPAASVNDEFGHATAALAYDLPLAADGSAEVFVAIPVAAGDPRALGTELALQGAGAARTALAQLTQEWQQRLGRIHLRLPAVAQDLANTLRTTIGYILINRDAAAIRPGPRDYARSWIRDGAITSSALLGFGYATEVRDFLDWFARWQQPDGRIPCCVDSRGADSVLEHDSNGQFIWAVAEYYRFRHDRAFVASMWPRIVATVDYIARLREQRLTAEYQGPDKRAFYGLMPESISHEGYSAHPVHSYWDDFFVLRGLKDAATLAREFGTEAERERFALLRDAFRRDLYASMNRTMATRGIDYLPGSVELADFDASSTAIAVTPVDELRNLPEPELGRTFDRYYEYFRGRADPANTWQTYSPYELRNVEALLRMGQKARALEVLGSLMADRRPLAWNHWAEVVWRDARAPKFIGDMPHTWVGSGFARALRTMLAYEREEDGALVLGAGIPETWLADAAGVEVRELPTWYGALGFTLQGGPGREVRVHVEAGVTPPGGVVLMSPRAAPLVRALVNGEEVRDLRPDRVILRKLPADVVLQYATR